MLKALGFAAAIGLPALGLAAAPASAQEVPGFWQRSTDSVNATTPFPLGAKSEQERGWFSGAWDGTKRIWREGTHDLYLSGYTWHLPYAYTTAEREAENALTYGLGFGKTLTEVDLVLRLVGGELAADAVAGHRSRSGCRGLGTVCCGRG